MDSIQAVVLKTKLPFLDDYCEARRTSAKYYNKGFENNKNIKIPTIQGDDDSHVFHQYTLQILNGKRDELHKHLLENNIPNAIYYPVALHKQKAYANNNYNDNDFKVTNKLTENVISLPMHTELEKEQMDFIIKTINNFV